MGQFKACRTKYFTEITYNPVTFNVYLMFSGNTAALTSRFDNVL